MSIHLDKTCGAAFVGIVVAAVLYGVSCVQALYYYMNQNDPWYTKVTVTAVMILDTVHQAFISHTVYTYIVTGWGDSVQLGLIVWSLVAGVLFSGIMCFIVQSVLTMNIWRLSNRNIYLTGIPAILAGAGFVALIVHVSMVFQFKTFAEVAKVKGLTISVTLLNALTDLIIAATLCTFLKSPRTGFHTSEVIVNRLIVFTVNTGLLTSLCSLATFISLLAASKTFIYLSFLFCSGRLYTNTLLATFNAREVIRKVNEADIAFSFHKNGLDQSQNLSIKIDTTTQKYHSGSETQLEAPSSPGTP